jgi:hypothetical protein
MTEPHTAPTNLRSLTTRLDNIARQTARPAGDLETHLLDGLVRDIGRCRGRWFGDGALCHGDLLRSPRQRVDS